MIFKIFVYLDFDKKGRKEEYFSGNFSGIL